MFAFVVVQCADEYTLLKQLYLATNGQATWKNSSEWLSESGNVCDWYGISCVRNKVNKIQLRDNGLIGQLPDIFDKFERLTVLDLGNNLLAGPIPQSLCRVQTLKTLLLDNAMLNGSIDDCICKLQQLNYIDLSGNSLSGELINCEATFATLEAQCNNISGQIPYKLDTVEYIDVRCNEYLTGCEDRLQFSKNMILCSNPSICKEFCNQTLLEDQCPVTFTVEGCDGVFVAADRVDEYYKNQTIQNK